MSSPFEQLVIDSLDRIETKCDDLNSMLADHAETDRRQFQVLESTVDTLSLDYAVRKRQAEDAGAAAGSKAGKFWAIIGTIIGAAITAVGAAAR